MTDDEPPPSQTPAEATPTNHEQYTKTQAQIEAIEEEIKKNQPLTSDAVPVDQLKAQYLKENNNSNFMDGCNYLATQYTSMRMIRGDGNCYYRAFLFSLCENLLLDKNELDRIVELAKGSLSFVTSVGGYDEMTIEIFYDSFVELLGSIQNGTMTTVEALHAELNTENSTSDYCTWYMRVWTATFLKSDPGRFLPYLEDGYVDIDTFCRTQIEPMGRECTMVQVLALAEACSVRVSIEYLDGHQLIKGDGDGSTPRLTRHCFGPEDSATSLTLLYRPGHYDILYPK